MGVAIAILRRVLKALTREFFWRTISPKYLYQKRVDRVATCVDSIWRAVYHATCGGIGLYLVSQMPGAPPSLGLDGDLSKMNEGFPYIYRPPGFDFFFCTYFGFYLEDTIEILFVD